MPTRRSLLATTATLGTIAVAGCSEIANQSSPAYSYTASACETGVTMTTCHFTFTLDELGDADYILVAPSNIGSDEEDVRLTPDNPETTLSSVASIHVFAVRDNIKTEIGYHTPVHDEDAEPTPQRNPQAGVTFEEGNGTITVQLVSLENADNVTATSTSTTTEKTMENVGDTVTLNVSQGDTVTVIGSLDGKEAVLQTYTVD